MRYMNCPHCETPISLFSRALMGPSKPGGARLCEQCGDNFKIGRNLSGNRILMFACISVAAALLLLIPMVGWPLFGGAVGVAAFLSLTRLEKV